MSQEITWEILNDSLYLFLITYLSYITKNMIKFSAIAFFKEGTAKFYTVHLG